MNSAASRLIVLALLPLIPSLRPVCAAGNQASNATLGSEIQSLFHAALVADDDTKETLEAERIYDQHGLLTIREVGDEPAYEFVVLLANVKVPSELRSQIALNLKDAPARNEIPSDAVIYYDARLRADEARQRAEVHPPSNPTLRDVIDRMYKLDQSVRQQKEFDLAKMEAVDRRHGASLRGILDEYGLPTYSMVGAEAAGEFVIMIQHQPPKVSEEVLPKLKAAVDAGEADPKNYAMVYDRSQLDLGKKQVYGERLECKSGEKMHEAPIEDEAHVDHRRAELGLIRIDLYSQIVAEEMPQLCSSTQH